MGHVGCEQSRIDCYREQTKSYFSVYYNKPAMQHTF